jgi:hypothetical protein
MPHARFLAPFSGLLLLACAFCASAGINTWTRNGPDSGWPFAVAIQPTNSQVALATTQRGLYRTIDGGQNWTLVGEQIFTASSIAFDPSLAGRVFVADNTRLWVSYDSGLNYALAQMPEYGVGRVKISSGGVIYAQTISARVFKSMDHGSTWTACGRPWDADVGSGTLALDPNYNNGLDHLFIEIQGGNSPNGTWRSVDGCATWIPPGTNSPGSGTDGRAYNYSVKSGDPNRVLAATNLGVKLSIDGGATWNVVTPAPAYWVEYDRVSLNNAVAITEITHSMRSVDSGDTWVFGDALSAPGEASFALDPQVSGRMLLATQNGMYQSLDSGVTFTLRNHGMHAGSVSHVSLADDGTVYAAFYPGAAGVFRRDPLTGLWGPVNNAALWQATISNTNHISALATAPTNSAIVYVGNYYASLTRSADSGAAWQQSHQAFINNSASPYAIAVDPDNAMVAYTATSNQGVFKTTDGGISWAQKNAGLPLGVTRVAAAPNSNIVYAVATDPNILYPGAIYKSTDGAETWAISLPPIASGMGWFNELVIDPMNPNVVYAPYHNGVYKTVNGGVSWALMQFPGVSDTLMGGWSVSIDPQFSNTVLVSHTIDGSGLARTVDGGANWERIDFFGGSPNARTLTRALILPTNPSQIVAFAFGANVEEYEVANDLAVGGLSVIPPLATATTFDVPFNVANYGPHGASPSRLSISFPSWLTPTVPNNCSRTGQTLNCDIPALNLDGLVQIIVPFAISSSGGTGTLTASITGHETELITANNTYTQNIAATERADLALSFTPASAMVDHNGSTTVAATVTNHGPSPSTGTTLALQIPAGLSWTPPTPSVGSCTPSGQTITCSFGTLAANASVTVGLPIQGESVGTRSISGQADGLGVDTDTDQTATVAVVVRPVGDASVSLAESDDPVAVSEQLTYTVTLRNESGDTSPISAVVALTGATLTGVDAVAGMSCTVNLPTGITSCEAPSLAAGATASAHIHVTGAAPGIAVATATAYHGGRDTNSGNDISAIGTTIRAEGDVSIAIAASADPVSVYAPFTYTVTVSNAGPNAGAVNIAIPVAGANVSSATTTAGSCTIAAVTPACTLTSLASGASATIIATAIATSPGTASATATATFVGFDPVASNNSATTETVTRSVADIGVTIAESADPVASGSLLSYRVTLTTAGPSPGNVHLSVPVTGSTVTGATPSQGGNCAVTTSVVTCDFAPMDFSPSTVDILINSATTGTVTANATVSFSGTDPVTTNNSAAASTTVSPPGSSGPPPGGGGGGGGRFDWLALTALAAFALGRAVLRGVGAER